MAGQYVARQGIALCGHSDMEGSLMQLLLTWAKDCAKLKKWAQERKYLSHDVVNEQVCMMGNCVLRTILANIKVLTRLGM